MKFVSKSTNLYFWPSLIVVSIAIPIANSFGQNVAISVSDLSALGLAVLLVALSIIQVMRSRTVGSHGKAWIFFMIFAVLWFVAEFVWSINELVLKTDPYPSIADSMWIAGYIMYLLFSRFYFSPFKHSISIKMIFVAVAISATILVSAFHFVSVEFSSSLIEDVITTSYPVMDAIVIAPTVIGIVLFTRGQVSFSWLLLLLGMICFSITDIGFQILSENNQYYSGHPIDIPYLLGYVFFIFGTYYHIRIFRKRNTENQFNNQEELR